MPACNSFALMAAAYSPSATPIGIVVALPAEARTLGAAFARNEIADLDGNARVYCCGAGPGNARRAVQALLATEVAGLVSWGTAGGLAPNLAAGTCVIAESVICNDAAYESSLQWCDRIAACGQAARRGAIYSSGEIVSAVSRKASLHDETGAVAVDTESGVVAELASHASVPFICIRAVTDSAGMTLPALAVEGLDEQGFPAAANMLAALARHPADLAALPRLARCFQRARRTLAQVRRDAGPRLLGP